MSNAIAAATQPTQISAAGQWALLLPWLGLALVILYAAGCLRVRAIIGPARVDAGERGSFFVMVFLATLGAGIIAGSSVQALVPDPTWQPFVAAAAFNSAGIAIMLGANALFRVSGLRRFGMMLRQLPAGLWQGAVGLFVVMPLVLAIAALVDFLARKLGIPSPVHDVLSQLRLADSLAGSILLIGVAVVLAPLFEEMLFRGVIQTFLVRALAGPDADHAWPDGPAASMPRRIAARWGAVVITSLAFAAVHSQLMWVPPLFALSVGLGFAYERTGNLWIPIVMHALFNALQITLFLTSTPAGQ